MIISSFYYKGEKYNDGDSVSCHIRGEDIDDAKLCIRITDIGKTMVWICQDIIRGSAAPFYHGYSNSWAFTFTLMEDGNITSRMVFEDITNLAKTNKHILYEGIVNIAFPMKG
jgi:hypothetical protein